MDANEVRGEVLARVIDRTIVFGSQCVSNHLHDASNFTTLSLASREASGHDRVAHMAATLNSRRWMR